MIVNAILIALGTVQLAQGDVWGVVFILINGGAFIFNYLTLKDYEKYTKKNLFKGG